MDGTGERPLRNHARATRNGGARSAPRLIGQVAGGARAKPVCSARAVPRAGPPRSSRRTTRHRAGLAALRGSHAGRPPDSRRCATRARWDLALVAHASRRRARGASTRHRAVADADHDRVASASHPRRSPDRGARRLPARARSRRGDGRRLAHLPQHVVRRCTSPAARLFHPRSRGRVGARRADVRRARLHAAVRAAGAAPGHAARRRRLSDAAAFDVHPSIAPTTAAEALRWRALARRARAR